jgi:hypothetical protein
MWKYGKSIAASARDQRDDSRSQLSNDAIIPPTVSFVRLPSGACMPLSSK